MSQPTVCAIMLVNGREAMVRRVVRCFQSQTYTNKKLLIWDTGEQTLETPWFDEENYPNVGHVLAEAEELTIGELRNEANAFWNQYPILCHWDSDEYSHPRRIEEQVALLQASEKQCVGYKDMLFWDTRTTGEGAPLFNEAGRTGGWAYLYRHPTKPLGTSLMYWRSVWEQRPFPDLPKNSRSSGEDYVWLQGVDHGAVSSFYEASTGIQGATSPVPQTPRQHIIQPRMIASIHGQNTTRYDPPEMERQSEGTSWKRAAEWDGVCREAMTL